MNNIITASFICILSLASLNSCQNTPVTAMDTVQELSETEASSWEVSAADKLWGLMTVWSQTDKVFPHRDRLNELGWDNTVKSWIPRILATKSVEEYYTVLSELVAMLKDSHTEIVAPWGRFTPGFDNPPIEVKILDDKFYIIRMGDSAELRAQNIQPGDQIVSIGSIPVNAYYEDNVLKYHSRGLKQADEALLVFYLFYGPKGEKVQFEIADPQKGQRSVELTRSTDTFGGMPFMYQFVPYSFAETLEWQILNDGSLYVLLPNFQIENTAIRDSFLELIDQTDFSNISGMVIDLRYNMGGSDALMRPIVSSLIDRSLTLAPQIFFQYTPAMAAHDKDPYTWTSTQGQLSPRDGKRYLGPLTILIGPYTHSSAEDMVLALAGSGRCKTIGSATAGGTGGSYSVALPWGGEYTVSSFKSSWPDGKEYMNSGIIPDYLVQSSLSDIINGNDPVIEKAMQVIAQLQ